LPLLEPLLQAARLPSVISSTNIPSIMRQLRRLAGIPKNIVKATSAPEPASAMPLCGNTGRVSIAVVAAFVVTVAVPVPLAPNAAVDMEQVGVSAAEFVGPPEFSVQLVSFTVPE
jgi:hypothetical protein